VRAGSPAVYQDFKFIEAIFDYTTAIRLLVLSLTIFGLSACKTQPEKPAAAPGERVPYADNAATEYVKSLQTSVEKAKAAAEKANRRIEQGDQAVQQFQDETR
jgi:hypothetical protein